MSTKLWCFAVGAAIGAILSWQFEVHWPQFLIGAFIIAGTLALALFSLNNAPGWIDFFKRKTK